MRDRHPDPVDEAADLWAAVDWLDTQLAALARRRASRRQRPRARSRRQRPGTPGRWPALLALQDKFQLAPFECDVLLLCLAVELRPSLAEQCAAAQTAGPRPFPTLSLAFELFEHARSRPEDKPTWSVLSPHRPLMHWRLVEIQSAGSAPLAAGMLRLDPRILNFLIGLNGDTHHGLALAPALQRWLSPLTVAPCELSHSQRELAVRLTQLLQHAGATPLVVHVLGDNAEAKLLVVRTALAQLAQAEEHPVFAYRLALESWPSAGLDVPSFVLLWLRERRLYPLLYLYLDAEELDRGDHERGAVLDELLTRLHEGQVLLAAREPRPVADRIVQLFDVEKPTPAEQKQRWAERLRLAADAVGPLVSRFHFNFPAIDALSASAPAGLDGAALVERLLDRCRDFTRPRLDALAERIAVCAKWDALVLPRAELDLLHQIADQVRHLSKVFDDWGVRQAQSRGLGLGVLFAGESGTGKTFAAEVLAASLRLDLYRIDLSAVVDKYIGETEKNLRRLFDAAEDGGCILLFDEADALFGKRSEIKDSHDRFANIQINYLLQRVESFRGLAILTTNRKSALDSAFLRRLRFVVQFPFPSEPERRDIWKRTLPREPAPDSPLRLPVTLAEAHYSALARWSLTGGNIRTVALNAAFLAAARGRQVDIDLVKEAARTEFRKLGREIPTDLRDIRVPYRSDGVNVELVIDRLIVDGVPAEVARRPELRAALQTELTRLFASGALPPGLQSGAAVPHVRGANLTVPAHGSAAAWGVAIARSVYGGMQS